MAVLSYTTTQYWVECDDCGISDCCADNKTEKVYSKQQAIKWAGMHKIKNGDVLCDTCYEKYKKSKKEGIR
jgi:hypothetical protein